MVSVSSAPEVVISLKQMKRQKAAAERVYYELAPLAESRREQLNAIEQKLNSARREAIHLNGQIYLRQVALARKKRRK